MKISFLQKIILLFLGSSLFLLLAAPTNIFALELPYTSVLGIPDPEFGITESYRMYDTLANRNNTLIYTQNTEGGYYTHYVDNSAPNATDTGNIYGTVAKPRRTIPRDLLKGSVVEVHNGFDENGWGQLNVAGVGTK